MTFDPNQPQPSPFATPDRGPAGDPPQPTPPHAAQPPYSAQPGGPFSPQPSFAASPSQPVPSFIPPTIAAAAVNGRPKGGGVSTGTLAFVVAVVIAAAGLGFAGGRLTAPAAATTRTGFNGQFGQFGGGANPGASFNPGRGGFGGFGGGGLSIDGKVTAVSSDSITVETANGQSVTLRVPSNVAYHAQAPATSSDVTVGSSVQVSVTRPVRGAEASGQPGPSGEPVPSGQAEQGAPGFSVTDITVVGK